MVISSLVPMCAGEGNKSRRCCSFCGLGGAALREVRGHSREREYKFRDSEEGSRPVFAEWQTCKVGLEGSWGFGREEE